MTPRHDTPPVTRLPKPDQQVLLHDLRTSLTIVTGNAQLLERWVRDGPQHSPEATLALLGRITGSARDMRERLRRFDDVGT